MSYKNLKTQVDHAVGWGISVMLFSVTLWLEGFYKYVWDGCTSNYKVAEKSMTLNPQSSEYTYISR